MKQRARDNVTPRNWTIRTEDTYMVHARIPHDLCNRLRKCVDENGVTITHCVEWALEEYLRKRGY